MGVARKDDGVPLNHSNNRLSCSLRPLGRYNNCLVKPGCLAPSSMIILLVDGVSSGAMIYAKMETRQVTAIMHNAITAEGRFNNLSNLKIWKSDNLKVLCRCSTPWKCGTPGLIQSMFAHQVYQLRHYYSTEFQLAVVYLFKSIIICMVQVEVSL